MCKPTLGASRPNLGAKPPSTLNFYIYDNYTRNDMFVSGGERMGDGELVVLGLVVFLVLGIIAVISMIPGIPWQVWMLVLGGLGVFGLFLLKKIFE